MKKILTLVLLIGVAITASSCKKEITEVTNVIESDNRTISFTVESGAWQLSGNTLSVEIPIPEIDDYFHNNGGILVYINRYEDGSYEQVPMVYDGFSYSYYHVPGKIHIDAQNATGSGTPARPDDIFVKVVLIDSNPID